jgi:hypothetical protein
VWSESDKLIKLLRTFENGIIADMEVGFMFPDHTDVKNAITPFRNIYLSVGSVGFWLVIDAREIDCEKLVLNMKQLFSVRSIT